VSGLVALGQPVSGSGQVSLADWGYLVVLSESSSRLSSPTPGDQGAVTALEVVLTADHDGLPAGSQLLFGHAEANAQANRPPPPPKTTETKTTPASTTTQKPSSAPKPTTPRPLIAGQPPNVTPKLTPSGYVFPVYGQSSFSDTFGAFRGDVSGGWHHGDDIFAPLGAPILACASGTVFSVGWNSVGGNRLWIRDGSGNLYYYAHLSAFAPSAVNGTQVTAGTVLGFVGNTGDAQGTPYHLHFEIHPVGLLGLGYDGAVDPTTYLTAWKHLQDVSFDGGSAWAPHGAIGTAPKSGAILISASDISSADGLEPGSLQRALRPISGEGSPAAVASSHVQRQKPTGSQATAAGP
jgi:murein DD-endopeptidase MepM/ murein hydrolase activator NlpD